MFRCTSVFKQAFTHHIGLAFHIDIRDSIFTKLHIHFYADYRVNFHVFYLKVPPLPPPPSPPNRRHCDFFILLQTFWRFWETDSTCRNAAAEGKCPCWCEWNGECSVHDCHNFLMRKQNITLWNNRQYGFYWYSGPKRDFRSNVEWRM